MKKPKNKFIKWNQFSKAAEEKDTFDSLKFLSFYIALIPLSTAQSPGQIIKSLRSEIGTQVLSFYRDETKGKATESVEGQSKGGGRKIEVGPAVSARCPPK